VRRRGPGSLNFGSTGNGSMPHLAAGAQLLAAAGDRHRAHQLQQRRAACGGDPAQRGAARLRRPAGAAAADPGRARCARARGRGTQQRLPWIPEVPTFRELGLPAVDASNWHGLVAPARTVEGPLAALRRAAIGALQDAEVRRLLDQQGAIPGGNSPEEFGAFIRAENEKWGAVIRRNNITAD
jgi:tripartite-type tricarboxylate transporter receptor subunit TctC